MERHMNPKKMVKMGSQQILRDTQKFKQYRANTETPLIILMHQNE